MSKKLVEKYKINNFKKLFFNEILIKKLCNLKLNLENIILEGNSGSGKTSIINIIKNDYKNNLSLSNFNSKGYDYIMTSLNNFIKIKSDNKKLIIFDNLDNISVKAQHIISEILNNNNINIIISCTNLNNIIESIQSNCIIIKLHLEKEIIFNNLKLICDKEKICYNNESISFLIKTYNYDIRKIINIIDIIKTNFNEININNINKLLNKLDDNKIKLIIKNIFNNNIKECICICNELIINGYSIDDILLSLINEYKISVDIKEEFKLNIINIINKKYIIINEVINSKLQLYSCIAEICKFNINKTIPI